MTAFLSIVPIFLFGTGIFYIIRLRGFYLLHPWKCMREFMKNRSKSGISPFRALTVALAGTLGVGNIVGVASALYLGGAGAVFWMLVSALVAMVLKYAEITLAVRHRREDGDGHFMGGAPYYIEDGFKKAGLSCVGRVLAAVFAALCLVNAITMGSILQINAVSSALHEAFTIPTWLTGIGIACLCLMVVRGGAQRIAALTERLVPVMTVGFLIACLAVIWLRRDRLPEALVMIWSEAIHPQSAGAGAVGFLFSRGIRYGVMRGLISNEAGCGTAPMAHATADTDSPAKQGIFGLIEVFIDTVLLCLVTALAILVSDSGAFAYGEDAVRAAQAAFSSVLGEWAGSFFAIAILLFGVATIICWSHYGMTCLQYLIRHGSVRRRHIAQVAYSCVLAGSLMLGANTAPRIAWTMADMAIAMMTVMNLSVLFLMRKEVEEETFRLPWMNKNRKKSIK